MKTTSPQEAAETADEIEFVMDFNFRFAVKFLRERGFDAMAELFTDLRNERDALYWVALENAKAKGTMLGRTLDDEAWGVHIEAEARREMFKRLTPPEKP